MTFWIKVGGRKPTMGRRQFLQGSAAAAGGLLLPHAVRGQESSLDIPPSQNLETPEAPRGIRLDEGLLPDNRVLLYYGFPEVDTMGILGEYPPEELLPQLQQRAEEYAAVAPDRPWKIGFELIGSVAQGQPGDDGMYIADTDGRWLDMYTQFTEANDMVLVIDVQSGRKEPYDDYSGLERWLRYDHVHLAIDPEFKMWDDEIPGQAIGHVTAEQVRQAQEWLAGIADKYGTSRKMLMVHQFIPEMIVDKDQITAVEGVDLVINEDGWGSPEQKRITYNTVITSMPLEYHGVKLFYKQDDPLMTPAEIMALEPTPDVVNYQ